MTSCICAVLSEELLSIFMVVQEEGFDCSEDECSKLFGNVAYMQLYIASYSRSMNVQFVCEGYCKLVNSLDVSKILQSFETSVHDVTSQKTRIFET